MKLSKLTYLASMVILVESACNRRTVNAMDSTDGSRTPGAVVNADTVYRVDMNAPRIQQAINSIAGGHAAYKFVQIEVVQVTNPQRRALTFEIRYQSTRTGETLLGSFSLYPADNPGKFIVPTLGKVADDGFIVLTMLTPDKIESREVIQVSIKKLTFVNGKS